MSLERMVVTGIAINTPIGDSLDKVYQNMLAGKSAITEWKAFDTSNIYSKIGGDISDYDVKAKLQAFEGRIPEEIFTRARKIFKQVADSTRYSILLALDAYLDSGLFELKNFDPFDFGVVCGGHNINNRYVFQQHDIFREEPEFIDGLASLASLDTDHSSSVSEILNLRARAYSVGGACASGNIALQMAQQAIQFESRKVELVVFPLLLMDPLQLQELTFLEAISYKNFHDEPDRASRPFDLDRDGFLPCEGGAVFVIESLSHALDRGATIHAEFLGSHVNSDANHLGNPLQAGQVRVMTDMLKKAEVQPEEIDFICAHATSTKLGDITEIRSIKEAFGSHASQLSINAPKSLLGHVGWSAAGVEAAIGIAEMNHGFLHRSWNVDSLDPEIDLDVCQQDNVRKEIRCFLNNSFGMGGINSASIFRKYDGAL